MTDTTRDQLTSDFRALCADLIEAVLSDDSHIDCTEIARRARAALGEADKPAVPECREPAAVTGQPRPTEDDVEDAAQCIYEAMRFERVETTPAWSELGNSLAQDTARKAARAVLARWGHQPAPPADVSQLSDGYHTFAELYEHRHSLMLALMRALPRICWFSRRHSDGELPFGSDDWFIVGAELPGAPITYHLPAALYSLAQKTGALELPAGRPWDGHSAADVVHRLRDWAIEPAPPADGEVAELVRMLTGIAHWRRRGRPGECDPSPFDIRQADRLDRAAELLERLASPACVVLKPSPELIEAFQDALPGRIEPLLEERHPAPVPVGERLPLPEVRE